MPKNPNSKSKPVKRDEPMNGAMKFFLAGCVAELYLLIVRRYFINGNLEQVVAWDGYLTAVIFLSLAVAAVCAVLGVMWCTRKTPRIAGGCFLALGVLFLAGVFFISYNLFIPLSAAAFTVSGAVGLAFSADRKKRNIGWPVLAAGAFLALATFLTRMYVGPAVTLLCVVVPVAMLLGILWTLYDRECAWSLTIMGVSLIALWVCRRELSSMYLGTYVKIGAVAYILLLAVVAFLARQADKKHGMLGKLRVLSADSDILPIYVACGLSAVAMLAALISTTVAYYAMWAMALVVFALAVYYTVKQL